MYILGHMYLSQTAAQDVQYTGSPACLVDQTTRLKMVYLCLLLAHVEQKF